MPRSLRPLRPRLVMVAGLSLLLACSAPVAWAQQQRPQPPQQRILLPLLHAVDYDPAVNGPLIVVGPPVSFIPLVPVSENRASLATIAKALDRRMIEAGQINVMVGRTMAVINTRPGKANPYGNLKPAELVKLLVSSFTAGQWQQIGSTNGIGAGDLNEDQLLLWNSIFPARLRVQQSTMKASTKYPGGFDYVDPVDTDLQSTEGVRLRINKQVTFMFSKSGQEDYSWGGNPYFDARYVDGQKNYNLMSVVENPDGSVTYRGGFDNTATQLPNSAYGVQLITEKPGRLKEGAIDFTNPALNVRVSLTDFPVKPAPPKPVQAPNLPPEAIAYRDAQDELKTLPTVGDLMRRLTEATGWEILADRRVRDLPVYLKGDSVRAGDLLMALAESVAGTYRQIEPGGEDDNKPLYLLTDDVEGIGTRVARLAEWAQDADEAKRKAMDGAQGRAAQYNPLAYLSFSPDDKYSPSEAQIKQAEDGWRKEKYAAAPEIKWADLSSAIQGSVQKFVSDRQKDGISIRTDRIRVGEELNLSVIIPSMDAVIPQNELSWGISHQFIQEIAYNPNNKPAKPGAPTKPATPALPLGFTAPKLKTQRRILVSRPADAPTAAALVRAAAARGITDIWLEVPLSDPATSVRVLTAATKTTQMLAESGKKIAVGGVLYLLKGGGVKGEAERNILNETGEEFRKRLLTDLAASRSRDDMQWLQGHFDSFTGWIVPDQKTIEKSIVKIAAVPGLTSLTLRATGAPGWTGMKQGGDGLWINSAFGYTPATRRAFLREKGIDPIDIPDQSWSLNEIQWNLGYFAASDGQGDYRIVDNKVVPRPADEVPRSSWWAFRKKKNDAMLSDLFRAVKKDNPKLSLYLDNRISPYAHANTDWFGSWDAAEKLPDSGVYSVESEIRADARRTSQKIFLHWGWWWSDDGAKKQDGPTRFAREATDTAMNNAPPNWNGVVLDMTNLSSTQLLRILTGLPMAP